MSQRRVSRPDAIAGETFVVALTFTKLNQTV